MNEEVQKDTSSATWKFDFADTVQADPLAKGGCLAVIRSYLNFASKSDPRAFCSLPELMIRTGLSKPAIRRAKELLVKLKYMEVLFVTEEGATMYKLVNARKQQIDEHIDIARESLAAAKRDRKRRERKAKGGNETIPPEDDNWERNVTPVENETLPNTVEEHRRVSCSEGREESLGVDSVYHELEDLNPYTPFSIPDNDNEAEEILSHVGQVHPVIKTELRRMLMAGELTPVMLMSNFGGGDGKSA